MKLTNEQIKAVATGVSYVSITNEGRLVLHRFSSAEEDAYRELKPNFFSKVLCSSGIRLAFRTDSSTVSLKGILKSGTSRSYASLEVFKDKRLVGAYDNYSHMTLPKQYTELPCDLGELECSFSLGDGEGLVEIYLPWSVRLELDFISLDDGASLTPVKRDKLLLAYGDSITQGYDALKVSRRYSSRLAELLGADEHNKAIGGEIFFPSLARSADRSLEPDFITVAYGTNDWCSRRSLELFRQEVREFFEGIRAAYPDVPIFALMPIWRKDEREFKPSKLKLGSLEGLTELIRESTAHIPSLYVIHGYDAVPHSEDYFADLVLHPNDEGYSYQARAFYDRIKSYIK